MSRLAAWLITVVALAGCADASSRSQAVYVLLDTSGTYADEIGKAKRIVDFLLGMLAPGDSLGVARIDSESFSEKDVVASLTFDNRPSMANAEKRAFAKAVTSFTESVRRSSHTDITGGLLQAVEYLRETGAASKTILVFSDLKEDLPAGFVRDMEMDLQGIKVLAVNVTKLSSDNANPRDYHDRLQWWRQRVEEGGGSWQVINDLSHLEGHFF